MPTVKPITKANEKAPSISDKAKAAESAAKEKQAAARAKIVESLIPAAVKALTSVKAKDDAYRGSLLDTVRTFRDLRDQKNLSKPEGQKLLTSALAQVYCGGDIEEVKIGNTAYYMRSKILGIMFPNIAKNKKAEANVAVAMENDSYGFNELCKIAGGEDPKKLAKKGKHGGKRDKGKSNAIEDVDTFGNMLSSLVGRSIEGGVDLDALEEQAQEVFTGYRQQAEEGQGEEEAEVGSED